MVPLPQGSFRRREARGGEAHHGGLHAGVRRQGGEVRAAGIQPPRTAERREAQVGQRILTRTPVWPTYITDGFFSWRFAMPVSCNAARRGKLTAGGITGRIALYDSCGIMEMNSAQNTKRTRFEHLCPRRVRTIKMAPRVGFEPTTLRLTAGCSAVELPRNLPISCVLSERAR